MTRKKKPVQSISILLTSFVHKLIATSNANTIGKKCPIFFGTSKWKMLANRALHKLMHENSIMSVMNIKQFWYKQQREKLHTLCKRHYNISWKMFTLFWTVKHLVFGVKAAENQRVTLCLKMQWCKPYLIVLSVLFSWKLPVRMMALTILHTIQVLTQLPPLQSRPNWIKVIKIALTQKLNYIFVCFFSCLQPLSGLVTTVRFESDSAKIYGRVFDVDTNHKFDSIAKSTYIFPVFFCPAWQKDTKTRN